MFKSAFVVDDSPIDLMLTSVVLQKLSVAQQVKSFNSGVTALAYIDENMTHAELLPDLILLDIYMPLMDGFGFLEELLRRNLPAAQMPLIVFVSSTINDYDFQKMASFSTRHKFVSKPVTMAAITQLIDELKLQKVENQ